MRREMAVWRDRKGFELKDFFLALTPKAKFIP
jgi:hypothetical protein